MPAAVQSALFTFIAMYIAKMVAGYGDEANAVQKIGSQIEALSWLTAGGIQTALGAFVGQNLGAMQKFRILKAVRYALFSMTIYGIFVSMYLFFDAKNLISIFNGDQLVVLYGIDYLKILAFSQLFMILEALSAGAFNGLSKTVYPSVVSIVFNLLRIPLAYLFITYYGLNGIWLAITLSSILKGTILYIWLKFYLKFNFHLNNEEDLSNILNNDTICV